ncbi:Prolyl oligopeptidase family protein [Chryseobacterium taichungense]|uniref:Prolyl oligopeptidase family protein n=1 Tax=Chryseobacterium taichungense TaxID=295069 RepID=A0A1H7XF02_9FLAO|nr:prolyl oligopeptidase family serine peptidase [Chryseobacterium taichungense]SEM32245.1 Prolyl oligopeptidase family protein [Chryseobacterium taichungense]
MNYKFFICLLISNFVFSQSVKLEERLPLDYEVYRDTNEKKLKKEYEYLNSLQFYGFDYKSFDNLKIRGFLIQPKKEGKYPVIVFNRGGNRELGLVSIQMMTDFLGKIAEQGFIVMGSQLRGSGLSEGQDEFGGKDINDVLSILDIIKTLPNADQSRIGMIGISRGVMTNFLVLKETDVIKSCISIAGIADLDQKDRADMKSLYQQLIPGYNENPKLELEKRSPLIAIEKMKRKSSSHFIIHGAKDEKVNVSNAFDLYQKLSQNNISARLKIYEDENHGINSHTDELLTDISNWFKTKL